MQAPQKPDTPAEIELPALRQDLRLLEGPSSSSGTPTWLLFDPVANRYFTFDLEGYQILSLWTGGETPSELAAKILRKCSVTVKAEAIIQIAQYLEQSSLTLEPVQGWRTFVQRAEQGKHGWIMWLVHNYLFIRIPLCRPQTFLDRLAPLVAVFYTRAWLWFIASIGAAGLYLVSQQWGTFLATFQHFFSLEGLLWYAGAICLVKVFHELGHACTAVRYGCRVPTMGVAFLVLMPMLYTDVTDAWKLKSRQQKLLIDAGGIIVELMIAALALFLWAFLPDGPARSAAFVLATTSLIASLAINLSPLMKFDGYFILADYLEIPNLQSRANALGRWKLREILFKLGDPRPETFSPRLEALVIAYAWIIWIYRLVVFTGIALAVYHMVFKLLGIILFAVEIIWFVLAPITNELKIWWQRRNDIMTSRRSLAPASILMALLGLAFVPWSGRVSIPAVLEPVLQEHVFANAPGRIEAVLVTEGQRVIKGQTLIRLASPATNAKLVQVAAKIALIGRRTDRRVADAKDRADTFSLEQQLASLERQKRGLQQTIAELDIKAPFDGRIAELPPDLSVGRWIGKTEEVALVVSDDKVRARGFLRQDDLGRIEPGARGVFAFDDARRSPIPVSVESLAYAGTPALDIPELASVHGGPIAVEEDRDRRLVPVNAVYAATMETDARLLPLTHVTRGFVQVDGLRESFAAAAFRQILKVLVRESGT